MRGVVHERLRLVALDLDGVDTEEVVLPGAVARRAPDPLDERVGTDDRLSIPVLRPDVCGDERAQAHVVEAVDAGAVAVERVLDRGPVGPARRGHAGSPSASVVRAPNRLTRRPCSSISAALKKVASGSPCRVVRPNTNSVDPMRTAPRTWWR